MFKLLCERYRFLLHFRSHRVATGFVMEHCPMSSGTMTVDELRRKIRLGKLQIMTRQELIDAISILNNHITELQREGFDPLAISKAMEAITTATRIVTENVDSPIFREVMAPESRIVDVNTAAILEFGYLDRDDFLAADPSTLFENPDERLTIHSMVDEDGFAVIDEISLKKKDGQTFCASLRTVSLPDEKSREKHCMMILNGVPSIDDEIKSFGMEEAQLVYGTLQGAVSALQATLEMMDHGTADEQQKIARLSVAISREMGLSREETTGIGLAAALHDIGKIYIPQGILDNTEGLTDVQMGIIQDHPEVGFNVLKTVELKIPKFPWPLAEIVLQHHERIDGSGYPQGLKGDEILVGARIIAVADVMVAMTTDRPHRKAPGLEKALRELKDNRGVLYDPDVVDACLKVIKAKYISLV